jgi:hypothetical protein
MSVRIPAAKKEYSVSFPKLDGGLNLWDRPDRMSADQSPNTKNMWWADGAITGRKGQSYISETSLGTGYAAYDKLFNGYAFMHIGNKIYRCDPAAETVTMTEIIDLSTTYATYVASRGAFFKYGENLYYKANGVYIEIKYDSDTGFSASAVTAYTPIIQINTVPSSGSGDLYQPENRLTPYKIVKYTAQTESGTASATASEGQTEFTIAVDGINDVTAMTIDGVATQNFYYSGGKVYYTGDELEGGEVIAFTTEVWAHTYQLPITAVTAITAVVVDGVTKALTTDYTVSTADGTVTFNTGKYPTYSADNQVIITFYKTNTEAYNSVMTCHYAAVYGLDTGLCIVLGGCEAQPNAYFWNANDAATMNPGYFPIEHYNLAGDYSDAITGFCRQQDYLLVFSENTIGRAAFCTEAVNNRDLIRMDYTTINAAIGCDKPYSIQLIENYAVFCNSKKGVFMVLSTSSAYENNIIPISKNVNGENTGLIADLNGHEAYSLDDGKRYWLVANTHAYVWDYELSPYTKPSWFYFINIGAIAFILDVDIYHLDALGKLTKFDDSYSDYGAGIEKVYTFPSQNFGILDCYKDITGLTLALASDTGATVAISYITDYGTYTDSTAMTVDNTGNVNIAKRTPNMKSITRFAFSLSNSTAGKNMTIVSAEVMYKIMQKLR